MVLSLTSGQLNAMAVTERVTSTLSVLGVLFILSTFLLARGFDKSINRLIFFASWSNLGMNIAGWIAEEGPAAGQNSSLCQFQAWAIQMFLGVDVFWALCMSFNVYLALFRGWTAQHMRAQEWKYFVACYGAALIPAVAYLFIKTESRGRIYGPALLWCWIDAQWEFLRLATLYSIVWVAITAAFCIYCLAFRKVWRNRHELAGLFNPFNEDPFTGTKTTEIEIVSTSRRASSPANAHKDAEASRHYKPGINEQLTRDFDPYTINIETGPEHPAYGREPSRPDVFGVRSLTRNAALAEANADAWLYARVAFLFFCALLVSWVPSSINRVYSLAHPNDVNFGLNYAETLVLPLQGFWNSCLYIIASQTACRNLWRAMRGRPDFPSRNGYSGDRLMDASESGGARMVGLGKGGRVERFNNRRACQKLEDQSDITSITSLTEAHLR